MPNHAGHHKPDSLRNSNCCQKVKKSWEGIYMKPRLPSTVYLHYFQPIPAIISQGQVKVGIMQPALLLYLRLCGHRARCFPYRPMYNNTGEIFHVTRSMLGKINGHFVKKITLSATRICRVCLTPGKEQRMYKEKKNRWSSASSILQEDIGNEV